MNVVATYLPMWRGKGESRQAGPDEDAVTMAVAAGRMAIIHSSRTPSRLVFVSREMPLLEGGNGAALLAGLDLEPSTEVVEQVGGAPAALDAIGAAPSGTLVLGADVTSPAGAGAYFAEDEVSPIRLVGRINRSLPLRVRSFDGVVHQDDDPRLQRERGLYAAFDAVALAAKPRVVAGLSARDAAAVVEGPPIELPTLGASSPFFGMVALAAEGAEAVLAASEQASLTAIELDVASIRAHRSDRTAQDLPARSVTPGPEIKLSFTAYERAFDSKVRWEAGKCGSCDKLAMPPRRRCLTCGWEGAGSLVPLPRSGIVYTSTTIHVPVPGLESPYALAIVELDDVPVRVLATVTDTASGRVWIGDRGAMVMRRVAIRLGVPDYGYAFAPELTA